MMEIMLLDSRLRDDHLVPLTPGSAGYDLRACTPGEESIVIQPGERALIHTGLAIWLDDPKLAGLVLPRSGLALEHGVTLLNAPGLIDSDYQGEIKVIMINHSDKDFVVQPLQRVAQLLIVKTTHPKFSIVSRFRSATVRHTKGFGSTGGD